MFTSSLSRKFKQWYQESPYRQRIDHVIKSLHNLKYRQAVIDNHVREWIKFTKYCSDHKKDIPSSIHAPAIQAYLQRRFPKGSASWRRCIRAAIRILIDVDQSGDFPRRMQAAASSRSFLFQKWVPSYISYLDQHRGFSEKTLKKCIFSLGLFTEFLKVVGIQDLENLNAGHIRDFCSRPNGCKPITWIAYIGHLRRFLKYVYIQNATTHDLSSAALTAKVYRYAGLPDVLTESEAHRLLASPDRSTPIGRRDYAILLLAARYGMRPSDIRKICLDNIHWRRDEIILQQSKTGRALSLPLLPEVSEALIDYLKNGRPLTKARNIFIRHQADFGPFEKGNNLYQIMKNALHRSGFDKRKGRRGLYLFRHTLATRMLSAGLPIKTIGDVLGHASTESTFIYTKVDLQSLREVSISISEVLQ